MVNGVDLNDNRLINNLLVHGQLTIIFVVSVGLSVCLFVQSFSQPSLIRFWPNLDICYMSGSSCVPQNIGAVRPLGARWLLKTGIFGGLGASKTISSYSFDRIVLIFGYIVERTNTKILSSHFFCNFHLGPKLWRHKWRHFRFCKSCRRAMRFLPLDSSEDFMRQGGLRFSLSHSFRVMTSSMTS